MKTMIWQNGPLFDGGGGGGGGGGRNDGSDGGWISPDQGAALNNAHAGTNAAFDNGGYTGSFDTAGYAAAGSPLPPSRPADLAPAFSAPTSSVGFSAPPSAPQFSAFSPPIAPAGALTSFANMPAPDAVPANAAMTNPAATANGFGIPGIGPLGSAGFSAMGTNPGFGGFGATLGMMNAMPAARSRTPDRENTSNVEFGTGQTAGMTGASSSASRIGFSRPSFYAPGAASPGNSSNTAASSGMGFDDIFGGPIGFNDRMAGFVGVYGGSDESTGLNFGGMTPSFMMDDALGMGSAGGRPGPSMEEANAAIGLNLPSAASQPVPELIGGGYTPFGSSIGLGLAAPSLGNVMGFPETGVQSVGLGPMSDSVNFGMMPNTTDQAMADFSASAAPAANVSPFGLSGPVGNMASSISPMDMATALAMSSALSAPQARSRDANDDQEMTEVDAFTGFGGAGIPAMARTGPMGGEGAENNAGLGMMPSAPAAMVADPVAPSFMNSVYDFFGLNQPGIDPASVRSEIGNLARAEAPDMVDRPFMASTPGMQADLQRVEQAMLDDALRNAPPGVAATPMNFDPITGVPSAAPTAMAGAFDFNPMDATGPLGNLTAPTATPQVAATSAEPAGFASMPPAVTMASIPADAPEWAAPRPAQPSTQPAVPADAVPSSLAARPAASTKQPVTPQEKAELVEAKTTASQTIASREGQMSQEQIAAGLQAIAAARNPAEVEAALVGRRPIMDPNVASTLFGLMGGPIAGPALRALMHYDDPLLNPPIIGEGGHYGQYDSASYGSGGESYDSRMDGQREEPPAPAPAPAAPPAAANPGALSGFRRKYLGAGDDLLRYGMAPKGEREYYEPVAMAEGGRVEGRGGALSAIFRAARDMVSPGGDLNPTGPLVEPTAEGVMGAVDFAGEMITPGPGIEEGMRRMSSARDSYRDGDYLNAAGNAMTGVLEAGMDIPQLGIFAGAGARTANRVALDQAKELAESGADRREIWDATGWFKGRDGQWRFEIDDSAARLTSEAENTPSWRPDQGFTSNQVLSHSDVYDAYPSAANIRTGGMYYPDNPSRGTHNSLTPETIDIVAPDANSMRSVMLHELQHGVQNREDFATGGMPNQMAKVLDDASFNRLMQRDEELTAQFNALRNEWQGREVPEAVAEQVQALRGEIERVRSSGGNALAKRKFGDTQYSQEELYDGYRRLAGEVEARNVQTRRDFTPDERRARPPWETQDVPDDLQIVRRGDGGPQMSAGRTPAEEVIQKFGRDPKVVVYMEPGGRDIIEISEIEALTQGKGHGSKALSRLTKLADANGARLGLEVSGDGADSHRLLDWYRRNGFEVVSEEPDRYVDVMRRLERGPISTK